MLLVDLCQSLSKCCKRYSSKYSGMEGTQEGESVDWLNEMVSKFWLNLDTITLQLAREKLQPMVQDIFTKYHLKGFKLKSLNLGASPPRLDNVKVLNSEVDKIVMEADVFYDGDAWVEVSFINISGGVTGIKLHGRIRVELFLVDWLPLVGGVLICFTNTPTLDFDLTGWANIGDMPGLKNRVREPILEQIKSRLMYPSKISVVVDNKTKMERLLMPQVSGVLVVKILEASNLSKKKQLFKISPFCELTLGSISKKTTTKEGTDPIWEEIVEFPLDYAGGIKLKINVMDKDHFTNNDFLGQAVVDLEEEARDVWIYLEGIDQGKLHLQTHLLRTSVTHLPLSVQGNSVYFSKVDPSKMLLMVFVESVVVTGAGGEKIKVRLVVNGEVRVTAGSNIKKSEETDVEVEKEGKGLFDDKGIEEGVKEMEEIDEGGAAMENNEIEKGDVTMERKETENGEEVVEKKRIEGGEIGGEIVESKRVKENTLKGIAEELGEMAKKGITEGSGSFQKMKKGFTEGLGKMGVDNKGMVQESNDEEFGMTEKMDVEQKDMEMAMDKEKDTGKKEISFEQDNMEKKVAIEKDNISNEEKLQEKNAGMGTVKVEEAFTFVGDEMKELKVEILDAKSKEILGVVMVDIEALKNKEKLEQPLEFFPVENKEGVGLNLTLRLRYLVQAGM